MKGKKAVRMAGRLLAGLLVLVLLVLLYVTLVVGQPQPSGPEATDAPVSLSPELSRNIASENDLPQLLKIFPVPVMSFMSGSGMLFLSGTCGDTNATDGLARVITLNWQTQQGEVVTLRSICPATALELMGGSDYAFSSRTGPTLFGLPTVCMENRNTLRLHVASGNGLYVVTAPRTLWDSLSLMTRSIQLFTAE